MAHPKAAWGMEVGASAIKALRLERDGDKVTVTHFAVVPHKKVLASPDVDAEVMTRLSLGQFMSTNDLEGEHLVVSVPGHAAFARFAKLPPVDPKKVPDIVKFEAVQQIPFPIDQVEWDYQTFTTEGSPEVEVGIFAITRDRVQQRLSLYRELGISPQALTLSPVAVYNAMTFDHELETRKGAMVYLDIGTHASDVIIAEDGRCWIRTFPLGGTHFTEAIASAFKLSYAKAEKLKQEASASKYAKQIMQAMRPVFSDLLQDLQRSIGYYQTLHRNTSLGTMVGLGSTFKIPGLRKFLGQQLQMQVLRLDEYKKISVAGREAATFAQNAVGMATAYGLALQGVGLGRIHANLVPVESIRAQLWRQKTKWFGAAAAVVVVGSCMMLYRPIADRASMNPDAEPAAVSQALATGNKLKKDYDEISTASNVGYAAENLRRLVDVRDVWPHLVRDVADALASTGPQPELLGGDIDAVRKVPPRERRLVQLEHLEGEYAFLPEQKSRRISVTMEVELSHDGPLAFLNGSVAQWLRDNAERPGVPYRVLDTISCNPDLKAEFRVTETGVETISAGGSRPRAPKGDSGSSFGGGGGAPAPTGEMGRRPPSGEQRAPPGKGDGGAAGGGAGSSGFGSVGGEMGKREKKAPRDAPGKGAGSGFGGADGQTGPSSSAPRPTGSMGPAGGTRPTGGGAPPGRGQTDLGALGPMPSRPSVYPPGTVFYRVPITFEVELLDHAAPPKPDAGTARAGGGKDAGT